MNYKEKMDFLLKCAYARELDPIKDEIRNPTKNLLTGIIIGDDCNNKLCFLYEDKENNIRERYEFKI